MTTDELIELYALRQAGEVTDREVMEWGARRVANDDQVLPIALLPDSARKKDVDSAIAEVADAISLDLPNLTEVPTIAILARARQIRDGTVSPVAGATSLAAIGRRFPMFLESVAVFIGILDDYDEGLLLADDVEAQVVKHAGRLVAQESS